MTRVAKLLHLPIPDQDTDAISLAADKSFTQNIMSSPINSINSGSQIYHHQDSPTHEMTQLESHITSMDTPLQSQDTLDGGVNS